MPRVSAAYLEARREEILAAAARCFARDGFHRTTMQVVADELGVSVGVLYRYFRSKDEMVAAIASQHRRQESAALDAAGAADPLAGLQALVDAYLGRLAETGEREWRRLTVQLWGESMRDRRILRLAREGLAEPLQALGDLLARAQREGRLPADVDVDALARLLAAVFQGIVLQQAWEPRLDLATIRRAAEALLTRLLQGPTAPPADQSSPPTAAVPPTRARR